MGLHWKCHASKSPDDQSLILFPSVFQRVLGRLKPLATDYGIKTQAKRQRFNVGRQATSFQAKL
jgi:hypothetical protein